MARSYTGVNVSMPSKVFLSQESVDARAVDWVSLGVGELSILGDSHVIELKLSGARHGAAKTLGSLVHAEAMEEDTRTLFVSTSDSMHRIYQVRFPYQKTAVEFLSFAEAAEAAMSQSRGSEEHFCEHDLGTDNFEATIHLKLTDRCPLVFGGCELHGPEPSSGTEVLIDRGALVLLDPIEDSARRVGSYDLCFYGQDSGVREPKEQFAIHPKTVLKQREVSDNGPAAVFEIQGLGGTGGNDVYTIAFDDKAVAASFWRDFQVRFRVMRLSLQTLKGQQEAQDVKDQIEVLKQQSLEGRFKRFLWSMIIILVALVLCRIVVLIFRGQKHNVMAILMVDAQLLVAQTTRALVFANARICTLTSHMVLLEDVRKCTQHASPTSIRQCIEALA